MKRKSSLVRRSAAMLLLAVLYRATHPFATGAQTDGSRDRKRNGLNKLRPTTSRAGGGGGQSSAVSTTHTRAERCGRGFPPRPCGSSVYGAASVRTSYDTSSILAVVLSIDRFIDVRFCVCLPLFTGIELYLDCRTWSSRLNMFVARLAKGRWR